MYVIFPTHVSTKEPIWFHAFVPSQKKVCHYVTFHNTVSSQIFRRPPVTHNFPLRTTEADSALIVFILTVPS